MKQRKLTVARIGNSRGVRLPAETLRRYSVGETLQMEERSEGILLRPVKPRKEKLSWNDTASAMAADAEDWTEWTAVDADGLDALPWGTARGDRVSDQPADYSAKRSNRGTGVSP